MKNIIWAEAKKHNEIGTILKSSEGDIFVSKPNKLGPMDIGQEYLILFWQEEGSEKLVGAEKISEHLKDTAPSDRYFVNQKLPGTIYQKTPMGYKVFFDKEYSGVLYDEEVFQDLKAGQKIEVYIKRVREDAKIDLSLQRTGHKAAFTDTQALILKKLDEDDGYLNISDKSSPEDIKRVLGISKKKYKDAIGMLYKQRRIVILKDGIKKV